MEVMKTLLTSGMPTTSNAKVTRAPSRTRHERRTGASRHRLFAGGRKTAPNKGTALSQAGEFGGRGCD
jgi:hypothetical protein